MLTTSFFKIHIHQLGELMTTGSLGHVLTVRTILLRSKGFHPVLFSDYGLDEIGHNYLLSNEERENNSPELNLTRGWSLKTLKNLIADDTSDMRRMNAPSETIRQIEYADQQLGPWFYNADAGLVMAPPITYRDGHYRIGDTEWDIGEEPAESLGLIGDGQACANSWAWPWCLHWADKDSRMVAWYDNIASVITGKATVAKLGKFLNRYGLSSVACEKVMDYVSGRSSDVNTNLKFAITADDIAAVYYSGPNSCMSWEKFRRKAESLNQEGMPTNWFNPVRAYAYPADRTEIVPESGNELALAYVGTIPNAVKGRTVVHMGRKEYSRIYGVTWLGGLLEEAGYKRTAGEWYGQKLSLLKSKDGEVCFPYLDAEAYLGVVENDYIRLIGNDDWQAMTRRRSDNRDEEVVRVSRTSSGILYPESIYYCAQCGIGCTNQGSSTELRRWPDNRLLCSTCADRYARVVVGFEGGRTVNQLAQPEQCTLVHQFNIPTSMLDTLTKVCPECNQRSIIIRFVDTEDGRSICRRCHHRSNFAADFVQMVYYDTDTNSVGSSYFRRDEGVTVVGYDLPVHIISVVRMVDPTLCARCGSMVRIGYSCTCPVEEEVV